MSPEDRRLQADEDLRDLMGTAIGRRFVFGLIDEHAAVCSSTYTGSDTHHTAYLEGRRSIGVELLVEVQRVCPSEYLLALQETLDERMREQIAKGTESHG